MNTTRRSLIHNPQARVGQQWIQDKKGSWKRTRGYLVSLPEAYSLIDSRILEHTNIIMIITVIALALMGAAFQ